MRKRRRFNNKKIIIVLVFIAIVGTIFSLKIYLNKINREVNKIKENTDISYIDKNEKKNSNGFFEANIHTNLIEYIKKHKVETVSYKLDKFNLTFEIKINNVIKDDKKIVTFDITKIYDPLHDVRAKTEIKNIQKIEYMVGNRDYSTVLRFVTDQNKQYFVIVNNNYYLLKNDIKQLGYINDQFYILKYNSKYKLIEENETCEKETIKKIKNFNNSDTYYSYARINFFEDFYQKLPFKKYTVKQKCDELNREKM